MIQCLVVDDQSFAANIIAEYIKKVPFLELAGVTSSPVDALVEVQKGNIDLVFLDIQMPELTGIQFMSLCRGKVKFILTTAYAEYALQGYELEVVDYLLKPVAFDRFLKAAQKAFQLINAQQPAAQPSPVSAPTPPANDFIFVKGESKHKFLKVNFSEILFIEGLKNYVTIQTEKQRIVTYQTLTKLESQLPSPPFYRVHKSYLVSLLWIRMMEEHTLYIGEAAIPIGASYRDDFYKVIHDHQG